MKNPKVICVNLFNKVITQDRLLEYSEMTYPAFLEMEQDDKSTMAMNLRLQLMQKRLEKVQSERKVLQTEREQRRADTRRLAEFRAENAMLKEQIETGKS